MAYGTLQTDVINSSTGLFSTNNAYLGIAKAWVYFNGGSGNTAGVINGSFNVSSITVNGTGNFLVNFTTAMPNTNYATIFGGGWGTANTAIVTKNESAASTSYVQVFTAYQNGANYNVPAVSVAVFSS